MTPMKKSSETLAGHKTFEADGAVESSRVIRLVATRLVKGGTVEERVADVALVFVSLMREVLALRFALAKFEALVRVEDVCAADDDAVNGFAFLVTLLEVLSSYGHNKKDKRKRDSHFNYQPLSIFIYQKQFASWSETRIATDELLIC